MGFEEQYVERIQRELTVILGILNKVNEPQFDKVYIGKALKKVDQLIHLFNTKIDTIYSNETISICSFLEELREYFSNAK